MDGWRVEIEIDVLVIVCSVAALGLLASLSFGFFFVAVLTLLPLLDRGSCTEYVQIAFRQQCPEFTSIRVLKCQREGGDGAYVV
jgi:Flp pilus assembly protein TadB